ncbi:MAG: hypothetical protein JWO25_1687 [Alphaproteobacteria bacterium]|nr:hypothetical protein [Alphaproteobacteria bacterium]MDB5721620.1 hypothetical protein [Alphaproteobacteria bacterium]
MNDLSAGGLAVPIDPSVDLGALIDPEPLVSQGRNWTRWAGPVVSVLILAAIAYQLRHLPIRQVLALLPSSPLFWLGLGAYYLAVPTGDWIIFRRLWDFPIGGFPALLRKQVSNEILLGYLGEVYFYAWARRHARVSAAPFGAIKDVAILSAMTGNAVTLAMVAAAAPFFSLLQLGKDSRLFLLSAVFLLVTSCAAMIFRTRLFTLPRRELRFVTFVHLARIGAMILLAAWMWHMLLPAVALSWWLLLATLRQLLSRLPFVPNKDVVFAGVASFFVGQDIAIVDAMALMAALILAAHLVVGGLLGAFGLYEECRP